jgi:2-(1,2-epoxy-1,2-dihydrophenyl)acetyl-CoA isomerase
VAVEPDTYRGFELKLHDPGIALITFNQPERLNGLTQDMKRDLVEILVQAQMDDDLRVVVFTGSGRAFSAGDDISGKPRDSAGARALVPKVPGGHHNAMGTYDGLRMLSQSLNLAIRSLDKITIAAINGVAVQTGLALALSCDFRIASTEARLTSGTLRFALMPDEGGHFLLLQMMGLPKTLDFLLRNRMVSAREALELGLVHEVVEPDHLVDHALDLAREFATGPQVAQRLLKRAIYTAAETTFAHALEDIATKTAISDHHPDAREGVRAFQEKRSPSFNRG